MSTWTNDSKASAPSWTNGSESSPTWTGQEKADVNDEDAGRATGLLIPFTYAGNIETINWTNQSKS